MQAAIVLESPYGLDVLAELTAFLKVQSIAAFSQRVRQYLRNQYGLANVALERIHVAGAVAVTVHTDVGHFMFKIDHHDDDAALHALLLRIERLGAPGLPLPRVHRTHSGALFGSPFGCGSDRAYLIDFVSGAPVNSWSAVRATATASFWARFHELGRHEPVQPGEQSSLASRWPEVAEAVGRLAAVGALPEPAYRHAQALIADGPPVADLTWTHIHGDARLCHVLFAQDMIAGVVDYDAGVWGHRVLDVAFHMISHPDSAKIAFLNVAAIGDWLRRYHARLPFTEAERMALPAALSCALLIEMGETLWNIESGKAGVNLADLALGVALLNAVHDQTGLLLESTR